MRSFLAGLVGLLAVLLLPVALLAHWTSQTVTRTDLFVEQLAPVVHEPQVQQALADGLTKAALDAANLRSPVRRVLEPTVRAQAARIVESQAVATAWSTGIRVAHGQVVRILSGEADTGVDAQGRVVLNVRVPVGPLTRALEQAGVPNAGAIAPTVGIPLASADQVARAQQVYQLLDRWGPWVLVATILLALLAIGLAYRWRRALVLLAVGGLVMCGVLALVMALARDPALAGVTPPAARAVADAAYGVVESGIQGEIWIAAAVSVGMLVVAGAGRLLART
ncbi:MAG: hypothetical protein L0H79_15495 [Intrasporangium sp.]|uniref:hypothetical protein n=1 Tax=Intrasporangium sp. TaxID=1925024 RepID=UPI0026499A24|nr:hypothetical protein [Intrasporangium sp.]MDN5797141.1 hypothetical protein [Intrasporangium sp.]